MNLTRSLKRLTIAAALTLPCIAMSQAGYPNQTIRMIVPFPPAGGTDTVARFIAEKIRVATNWNFLIDNRPGAGGNIGLDMVAKGSPDGYTIGMAQTANLAINPALYARMPYDSRKDIEPIALVAGQPMVLVVSADAPWKSLKELVAAAKAKPRALTMASAGNGTVGHLTGELFERLAGFEMIHVPYKGASQASTDLSSRQVDFYFATPQTVIGLVKAGRLRALAVSSIRRLPALADVPTVAESGYPGFDVTDWKMLVGPANLPADVVKRLHDEVQTALSRPETTAQLEAEGSLPLKASQQDAVKFVNSEYERWGKVVRDADVKIE